MTGARGWFQFPRAFQADEMDAEARSVYLTLSSHTDFGKETGARLGDKRLADESGCSVSTAQRRRRELRDRGWIDWTSTVGSLNDYIVYRERKPRSEGPTPRSEGPTPSVAETDPLGQSDRQPRNNTKKQYQDEIEGLFELCLELQEKRVGKRPGPPLKLTPTREGAIRARRREGFSFDELEECARGFYADSWPDRDKHLDPYHAFKNDETVRGLIERHRNTGARVSGPKMERL